MVVEAGELRCGGRRVSSVWAEEGVEAREEEREVAEAREGGDERGVGVVWMGNVKGHLLGPEGFGDGC